MRLGNSVSQLTRLPGEPARKLHMRRHFFVHSISEVHVCMCVHVQSLTATRVLSRLGPEHPKPPSYRPLTYRGAVPGLPESCCVARGQPTTPAAKRERLVGWQSMR